MNLHSNHITSLPARGGKRMDEEDPPQPQVVVKRRGSGDPKPKKQARARSWFGVPRKYQVSYRGK